MSRPRTIAIDGPAGSGKSSISQRIAERFGYIFVDTGAFYRAITYLVLKAEIPTEETERIAEVVRQARLEIQPAEGADYRLFANGEDVTDNLRSRTVESHVSAIAQMPIVRELLLPLQRQVAMQGNIIMAGRDIGTVVLPDAELKLFIDASLQERARRRHQQITDAGKTATQEAIEEAMAKRDKIDSERSVAPLVRADDAIYILTDRHSLDDVVEQISAIIESWKTIP